VAVIDAAVPMAFCAGWLRPRVFVSTAALRLLSGAELDAVLAHEHHHLAVRDPLRLAVGRVLCQALFFLPVLRPLHERYGEVAELTADAAALAAVGGELAPLAAAMLTFGSVPSGDVVGISPGRVDSLLGRPPAWRLPRAALIAALVTLAAVVALVWRAGSIASANASLNLPIASSQPCLLVLALIPVLACVAAAVAPRPRLVPSGA
jgi:BlaR1 peptidase M56